MRPGYYILLNNAGLVVQWIVQEFPELLIQVRFLARSLFFSQALIAATLLMLFASDDQPCEHPSNIPIIAAFCKK